MRLVAVRRGQTDWDDYLIDQSFRLRARIFADRLNWDVRVKSGREMDGYDDNDPTYLLALGNNGGTVVGGTRLLPCRGPTMIFGTFRHVVDDAGRINAKRTVESSRFCLDTRRLRRSRGLVHECTRALFAGVLGWAAQHDFDAVVTVTDLRLERLLARVGIAFERLGEPRLLGSMTIVAGKISTGS